MQIVEQTDNRLVLRQRRLGMGLVMAAFSVLTGLTLVNILVQGVQRLGTLNGGQLIGWVLWLGFIGFMATVGVIASATMLHGVTCTFDRVQETAAVQRTRYLRMQQQTFPIYSVSHLAVEQNAEVRVFGLFLVLRSGERIALATVPPHDEETIQRTARVVKGFLLHRFQAETA